MMRPIACFAAAAALLTAAPVLAHAQTPAPSTPQPGLSVAAVSAWLTSKGGQVGPVQHQGGETFVAVTDGPLTWAVFFYGCAGDDRCGDIQFTASFSNPTITMEKINDWNRDKRFLKAFYAPGANGEDPSAAVQYDVLVQPGGVEQLNDPTAVWVGLVGEFATAVGYFQPEGEAPAAAPTPGH